MRACRSSSSRSSERNRCAPRLVATSEWISSMITVSIDPSVTCAPEVSRRYSDSGVVMRMSGGCRSMRARSAAGVSPVRTSTVGMRGVSPAACARGHHACERGAQVSLHVHRERLQRRDVEHGAALLRRRLRRAGQLVDRREERRQGLARAGGREQQGRLAAGRSTASRATAPSSALPSDARNHAPTGSAKSASVSTAGRGARGTSTI